MHFPYINPCITSIWWYWLKPEVKSSWNKLTGSWTSTRKHVQKLDLFVISKGDWNEKSCHHIRYMKSRAISLQLVTVELKVRFELRTLIFEYRTSNFVVKGNDVSVSCSFYNPMIKLSYGVKLRPRITPKSLLYKSSDWKLSWHDHLVKNIFW